MKHLIQFFLSALFLSCSAAAQGQENATYNDDEAAYAKLVGGDPGKVVVGTYIVVFNQTIVEELQDVIGGLIDIGVLNETLYEKIKMARVVVSSNSSLDDEAQKEEHKRKILPWLKSGLIEFMEEDQVVVVQTEQNFPTWGLDRVDQSELPLNNQYHYDMDGDGVTAYIIDTGIRATHEDFGGRATCPVSFVRGENCDDGNGHGTHVSGTIGSATYGVAKSVNLVGVKVLNNDGSGANSAVIDGINWVLEQALSESDLPKVCNLSIGGFKSLALNRAVSSLVTQGGVFTAVAAGNENVDACLTSPASANDVTTVGATDKNDRRSSFSNFGTCVDIFAPGTDIDSTWFTSDTATNRISGTSMASPHVAGVAALYLQANPGAAPGDIKKMILANAVMGKISDVSGSPNSLVNTEEIFTTTPLSPPSSSARKSYRLITTAAAILFALIV